jgi:type II secretory pathway pseudopilin PulG
VSEPIVVALVAVVGVIAGAIITGVLNYYSTQQTKKVDSYKSQLRQAYKDISAFHRLEERYVTALAKYDDRTKDSWKRDIRKQQADDGLATPSKHATAREAEEKLEQLE